MKKIKVYGWIYLTILCLILVLNLNSAYGQSVETSPKMTPQQKPTFAGQTRVSAVKSSTKFSFKVIL